MSGASQGEGLGRRGFSLVETAVTVAVIGLLAAIAFPSLRGTVPRVRLRNNVSILVNEIALARRQAIAQNVDYSIVFDTSAETYSLWKGAAKFGANTLAGSDIVDVTGFSPTTAPVVSSTALVVLAGGAMNVPLLVGGIANYGYITLQTPDGSHRSRIRVEPLGRVIAER